MRSLLSWNLTFLGEDHLLYGDYSYMHQFNKYFLSIHCAPCPFLDIGSTAVRQLMNGTALPELAFILVEGERQ